MDKRKDIIDSFGRIRKMAHWNPNVARDLKKYVYPDSELSELNTKLDKLKDRNPKYFDKVVRYLDIVELIYHMKVVYEEAQLQNFKFHGKELVGLSADIDALNLYLSLAAMDVISKVNFTNIESWLLKKGTLKDFDDSLDIREYIEAKIQEYNGDYGMKKSVKAIYDDMEPDFKARMVQNTAVIKVSSVNEIVDKLCECNFTDKIEEEYMNRMDYIFGFRNAYTHNMVKVAKPHSSECQSIMVCKDEDAMRLREKDNKKEVTVLIVRRGYILEDALLEISAHCCRKYFEELE